MKNTALIFILIAVTLFWSCSEPPVVFGEAQPQGVDNDPYILPIYQGVFLCESDSSIVYVKNQTIHKEKAFDIRTTIQEIEEMEEVELRGTELHVIDQNRSVPVEIQGDSIFSSITLRDTLLQLGPKQTIRFFKGHLVLSKEIIPKKWEVLILSLDNNLDLILSDALYPTDLQQLQSITPVQDLSTEDKVQFKITPTIMEFDQILNERLIFEACDQYTRIHLPVIM